MSEKGDKHRKLIQKKNNQIMLIKNERKYVKGVADDLLYENHALSKELDKLITERESIVKKLINFSSRVKEMGCVCGVDDCAYCGLDQDICTLVKELIE